MSTMFYNTALAMGVGGLFTCLLAVLACLFCYDRVERYLWPTWLSCSIGCLVFTLLHVLVNLTVRDML